MEFLRQKLVQVKSSWDQLSASGRLALTLTVVLVIALLVIVTHYAGSPDMVPLPTQFQADELGPAVNALRAQDIAAEVRGGQVYVVSDKRSLALGLLATSGAMPESGLDFDKYFGDTNMWESETDKERRGRYLLKQELERCIATMPGVRRVSVNINFGSQYTIRTRPDGVSASISVETSQAGPLNKPLARAMASLVSGAVHGLAIEGVKVVDVTTGRTFDLSADSALYSADYVQLVRAYVRDYESRLVEQFSDIEGLKVGVHVVPDLDKITKVAHTVDPTKTVSGETAERTSESSSGAAGGEVGVIPNAGAGSSNMASAVTDTSGEERVGSPRDWSTVDTTTQVTPGAVKEISAAISVPRSYLIKIARLNAGSSAEGGDAEVDKAAIDGAFANEKLRIAKQAAKVIGTKDESAVDVDWHYDFEPASAVLADASGGVGFMALAGKYGPSAGLAVLALMALFMVYNVVRKFQPTAMPTESVAAEAVGETGLTLDSILEGVELEADTIRVSKMQEQISNMIKEDPDSVANLVKRWVAKE